MRKSNALTLLVFTLCLSLGACRAHSPQNGPALSPSGTPQNEQLLPRQQTAAAPAAEMTNKADGQIPPEPTRPDRSPSDSQSTPAKTASARPAPDAPQAQTASAARAKQTDAPFIPAPDRAVFDGEELIDLNGRLLNPYAAVRPDAEAKQDAPWAYEQLKYGIYYGFIKAGTAYIRNRGLTDINGRKAYLLQTTAFSASVIDAFFKVRDVNYSWLDAENFYSLGYGQSVREGGYKRDEWLVFDYEAGRYSGKLRKKEAPRAIEGPLDVKVLDMLTSLYYVRAQKLTAGEDIVFDIVNREKQYPLLVKVLRKETVKTAAGKFDCVVVEPQLRGEGIFVSKGKNLQVWLTDDAYKMPVKMKVEVFIGSVSAELLEYKRQAPENIL